MRPLKIRPRHPFTGLALSPLGRQLGVVQSQPGFRVFDTLTGAEVGRDTDRQSVREASPTGRHELLADRAVVRLAEVIAGRPFLRFQTGWTHVGGRSRPPAKPETSALPPAAQIYWTDTTLPTSLSPSGLTWRHLYNAALSADHRFAVGHLSGRRGKPPCVVRDLATERTIATLDLTALAPGTSTVQLRFTPDHARIVAGAAQAIAVFDLPPELPSRELLLPPSAAIRVTQPQPTPGVPPFAVLPCGQRLLVRGEKSRIELRDLATGEVLTVWKWGLSRVDALAVAGDGLTAAAAGTGGQVVLWDLG